MSGEYRRMMNCGLPMMLYTLHCINEKIHFRKSNMFFCFSFRFINSFDLKSVDIYIFVIILLQTHINNKK